MFPVLSLVVNTNLYTESKSDERIVGDINSILIPAINDLNERLKKFESIQSDPSLNTIRIEVDLTQMVSLMSAQVGQKIELFAIDPNSNEEVVFEGMRTK